MIPGVANSVFQVPIRLTRERWNHIVRNHPEMNGFEKDVLEVVSKPEQVIQGHDKELLAIKFYPKSPVSNDKYLIVVYREIKEENDGFIITSYFTRRFIADRRILWKH